jgi:hypothetical protein
MRKKRVEAEPAAAHQDFLPAIYGGKPPTGTYGSAEELRILEDLRDYAIIMHEHLTTLLTTFGPKPDMQIAAWQEDLHIFLFHLTARIRGE